MSSDVPFTLPDGTVTSREAMRSCTMDVFDDFVRTLKRPPTIKELVDVSGVPANITKAFLAVANRRLTDGRALRYQR